MKLTLIITTYNSPKFLKLVLDSVRRQIELPDEVIVADDGSTDVTRQLIKSEQRDFPTPLLHAWQEDLGFRAAKSRNNGVRVSTGDYIVLIDGDVLLDRRFVRDHRRMARKGFFVQGRRVHLTRKFTETLVEQMMLPRLNFFSAGILYNRMHLVHSTVLCAIYRWIKNTRGGRRVITANLAVWKQDLERVNGFNEEFVGWGREDSELGVRLMNAGVGMRFVKFAAIGVHLFHKGDRKFSEKAEELLNDAIRNRATRCVWGLDNPAQ